MKIKILIGAITLALVLTGLFLLNRSKILGEGELPIEELVQEAKADGYKVDGSQDDFYKLYTSNPETANNVYELISAAKERIVQEISAKQLLEEESSSTEENIGAVELTEAQKIFLEEYSKLDI